ncbi:MAG: glycosyltransferase [Candidatus Altiarchaeota archaeon]|nr:glycosyltransferase [Candidatus Altiarchaeota archaeon]
MKPTVERYRPIVGDEIVDEIYEIAHPLRNKHIVHLNSTYQGGGVAEILQTLVALMNDVGIRTGWRILHGTPDFFEITKKFHNALQGNDINLTDKKKKIYEETNERFSSFTHLDHDLVFVHDPQPLPLIKFYAKKQPWVWRLHIDISKLNNGGLDLLNYLKSFILRYDAMIVSMEKYKKDMPIRQEVIPPSIDPLSSKNEKLSSQTIDRYLNKFGVDRDKPFITQVSRFDKFKDPEGVLRCYQKVKEKVDCRLVMIGNMASDDPEGESIYRRMITQYGDDPDVIFITATNNVLVNALQTEAACVIQKSLKEGFALTVSEALWKKTPVVASNVGGIPAQIIDGVNGYLVNPKDINMCADRIVKIMQNEKMAAEMGEKGHEIVKKNFLITRHLKDYLLLFGQLLQTKQCDNTPQ